MAKKTATLTETYKLPSLGKPYCTPDDQFPEEVTIRSMTTLEEKKRLGNQGFWKTICSILDDVVISPDGFEAKYATLFDFYFLMYKMRVVTYGKEYKVRITCPDCGKEVTLKVDLDKLNVNYLDGDFQDTFKIGPLPRSKDILECRFERVQDKISSDKKVKDFKEKNPDFDGDPTEIFTLASRIVTINGESKTPIELQMYVEDMSPLDSAYLNQAYNKIVNPIGMNTLCHETCPSCGEDIEFNLPFTSEFFRPTFDI